MKKLKNLCFILLCAVMVLSVTACSDDDDEIKKEQARNEILGSWSEVTVEEGDYASVTLEIIWTFNSDNTASQQVVASLNDYVFTDVTNTYSYVYDGQSSITFTDANGRVWTYSIEVSDNRMKLGNEEDGYFYLTRKS